MGSWNGTCGLSNLPIIHGDKVRYIILINNDNTDYCGGFCYAEELFAPIFLPISGKYNDYGSLEDIEENYNTAEIIKYIKNEYKNDNLTTDEHFDDNIQSILRHIERGHIRINDCNLTFMFVLEDIYKLAIELSGIEKHIDTELNEFLQESIDTQKITDPHLKMMTLMKYNRKRILQFRSGGLICGDLERQMMQDPELTKTAIPLVKEFRQFYWFMDMSRKHFSPQAGAGSQNDDYKIIEKFSRGVIKVSKDIQKKHKAFWGE